MDARHFPHLTDYVNDVFARERERWDFVYLRPILLVTYFFVRFVAFPIKFLLHRIPFGHEARAIDWCMAMGLKYLATEDAAELFVRHLQIEPLLYRHILGFQPGGAGATGQKFHGIGGDFGVDSIATAVRSNLTLGHDQLSYEVVDRFDRDAFLAGIEDLRARTPEDHDQFSKAALDENRRHSLRLLGPTNVVLLIVMTITIFGDLKSTVRALNSFGSDSLLLWCLKHLYANDPEAQVDLDFFMQEMSNRGHYNASAFFSNPSQYLYYHIVFDEVGYELLTRRPPSNAAA